MIIKEWIQRISCSGDEEVSGRTTAAHTQREQSLSPTQPIKTSRREGEAKKRAGDRGCLGRCSPANSFVNRIRIEEDNLAWLRLDRAIDGRSTNTQRMVTCTNDRTIPSAHLPGSRVIPLRLKGSEEIVSSRIETRDRERLQ